MKKLISILCLVVLAVTMLIPVVSIAEQTAWVKTGNGKSLNMRDQPSKNGNVVRTLPYRTQLIVHEFNNGWALVEPADWSMSNPAWVSTSFLVYSDPGDYKPSNNNNNKKKENKSTEDVASALDAVCKQIKYCAVPYEAVIKTSRPTNYVHLRWYPDTNAVYSAQYLCDTKVTVLAESNKWALVEVEDGKVGFILHANVDALYE